MKKDWRDLLGDLLILSIPTKTDFRGISEREVVLFTGPQGWSEFSPFIEYSDHESLNWLRASVEAAFFEWPTLKSQHIAINATLPRIAPSEVELFLSNFPGVKSIKMKVNSFDEDKDVFREVHRILPDAKIRIDVNGLWSLEQAKNDIESFYEIAEGCIDYFEQPVASSEELKSLRAGNSHIRIAADESIRKNLTSDLSEVKSYADQAIIKWQPSGGIAAATSLINKIGLPATISSALETSVGISHGLALASSITSDYGKDSREEIDSGKDSQEIAAGLGTVALLAGDVISEPLIVKNGVLPVARVEVDKTLARAYLASAPRVEWWQARLDRVWALIGEKEIEEWGWSFL